MNEDYRSPAAIVGKEQRAAMVKDAYCFPRERGLPGQRQWKEGPLPEDVLAFLPVRHEPFGSVPVIEVGVAQEAQWIRFRFHQARSQLARLEVFRFMGFRHRSERLVQQVQSSSLVLFLFYIAANQQEARRHIIAFVAAVVRLAAGLNQNDIWGLDNKEEFFRRLSFLLSRGDNRRGLIVSFLAFSSPYKNRDYKVSC